MLHLVEDSKSPPLHYYGDKVRVLYILGSLVMLVTLPFFITRLPITVYAAIFLVVMVGLFAGFTNPRQFITALFDMLVSLIALCIFAYYAVSAFLSYSWTDGFVWVNEILSVIFFFAFYYAVKTVRGFLVERLM